MSQRVKLQLSFFDSRWILNSSRLLLFALLFFIGNLPAENIDDNSSQESRINLDGTPFIPAKKLWLLEGGVGYSIGSGIGFQPELAAYTDLNNFKYLPGVWQGGFHTRVVLEKSESNYDFLPQINLELRKIWLGEEGASPLVNSEYFSFSLGSFFGYTFDGEQSWFNPIGSLAMGKYWMPLEKEPFGLDLSLELSRLFTGHLQGFSQLTYVTTCIRFFYIIP